MRHQLTSQNQAGGECLAEEFCVVAGIRADSFLHARNQSCVGLAGLQKLHNLLPEVIVDIARPVTREECQSVDTEMKFMTLKQKLARLADWLVCRVR